MSRENRWSHPEQAESFIRRNGGLMTGELTIYIPPNGVGLRTWSAIDYLRNNHGYKVTRQQ